MILDNNDLKVETLQSNEWPYDSYGVRMTHLPTGLSVDCSVFLTMNQNFRQAKLMLADKISQAQELK